MLQDGNVIAWYNSYPVKRTLEIIGEPDGTDEWIANFTATLFEVVEQIAEAKERFKVNRFLELRTRWENAVAHCEWYGDHAFDGKKRRGGQLPVHLLREMVELLPIDKVAYSLRVEVGQVVEWLFPRSDVTKLADAAQRVVAGVPAQVAAQQVGIHYNDVLLPYLRAFRIEAIAVKADGRRVMPPSIRQRIVAMAADGLGPKEITDKINLETGCDVKYAAVKMLVRRAVAA